MIDGAVIFIYYRFLFEKENSSPEKQIHLGI